MTAPVTTEHPEQTHTRSWWPLVAVCVGVFMLLIDITVVNVALPDMERDLHAGFSDLQWVIDAYALTLAAFLLTAGSVGDRLGRRRVFVVGIVIFVGASLGSGLAPSATVLSASRAVQGIGGAIMFANSLALLAASYTGRDRATAFGVWGAAIGASVAIGPLIGGILTTSLGWRWIFYVNLPIGVAAVAITLLRVGESRDPDRGRIDWLGLLTFSTSLALLVVALIEGNDWSWSSARVVTLFAVSAALMAAFAVAELRVAEPMLDLHLFRRPAFVGAQLAAFGISAAVFSMFLYLSLYLQNVLGHSAFQTGLLFLPPSAMSLLIAPVAGRATTRVPYRVLIATGLALGGAGLLLQRGLTASSTWTALLAGFFVMGIGIGLVNAPLGSLAVSVVPPQSSGMASGINNTFRQVGIATGTAAFGAIFASRIGGVLGHDLPASRLPAGALGRLTHAVSAGVGAQAAQAAPAPYRAAIRHASRDAFTAGLNELFLVGGGIALVAAVVAAVLIRQRDVHEHSGAPGAAA